MNDSLSDRGWYSRGYLPHLDASGAIQFVTFRLIDSLPVPIARELAKNRKPATEFHAQLDSGRGSCWLLRADIAEIVEAALLHFDGVRYRLLAWCVMPNHVHVVIETLPGHQLANVVRSWKAYTAAIANKRLGRTGAFWYPEYFDRFMRDHRHLEATISYVEFNPVKAGLVKDQQQWRWSSGRRRDALP